MNIYRITGTMQYVEACECPYCEGHNKKLQVNEIVEAADRETAAERFLSLRTIQMLDHDWCEDDVLEEMSIVEFAEDQRLMHLGMPTLFPMEQAP